MKAKSVFGLLFVAIVLVVAGGCASQPKYYCAANCPSEASVAQTQSSPPSTATLLGMADRAAVQSCLKAVREYCYQNWAHPMCDENTRQAYVDPRRVSIPEYRPNWFNSARRYSGDFRCPVPTGP